jgi:putative ABC transport system permease protein
MKTRYKKVMRDLSSDYSKNFMLVLAIAIGVFGIGAILGGYSVINREMTSNYRSTVPASATVEMNGNISKSLLDSVRRFPGIKEAERRATLVGKMKVNDRWYPILLFVIDDFNQLKTNKFHHLSGAIVPQDGTMLVERTALTMMEAAEGDQIIVRTPHGTSKSLSIAGIVHDPGLAPAWQEQAGYAYISMATLNLLGETQGFDLLRILVSENESSPEDITKKAEALSDWLNQSGHTIHEIQVPPPGKHPHQSQMNAILSIFTLFSFMILILGSILVATSMATLMVKQVRQIGVMKTIGATSLQIGSLYLFMMLILCVIALLLGIPLSRLAASVFYNQIAALLNLEINDSSIPLRVPLIQIAAGILIPIVIAAVPVIRGSRLSVREALDNFGVNPKVQSNVWITLIARMNFLSDTFRLSLRNAFRQRSRFILTLGLLAAGGAMFMTALNVSDAWDKNLKRIYIQRLYDQEIRLNERMDANTIIKKIKAIDGVKTAEGWDYYSSSIVKKSNYKITRTYPDKGHGSFAILALPVSTQLLNPTVTEGKWLSTEGSNEVVLNQLARTLEMKIGDQVKLVLGKEPSIWKIVGFTEDVGSPATAYVSITRFSRLIDAQGKVQTLRVGYNDRSRESAISKNKELDQLMEKEKISVSATVPVWMLHNAVAAHMRVLVNSLLAMAILMALVGTMGLMSTVSMNVLERTREIGVMRAIGATPERIRNLIVWEGLTIGVLSVLVAFSISLILSFSMGRFIGHISFRTPLSLTVSSLAIVIWIGIILAGSYIATFLPARRANKVTTREALAYE